MRWSDHMAQLVPLPLTVSCFSKIQIGFTSLVPAHPGSPGKRAVKRVYVCMYVFYLNTMLPPEAIFQSWNAPHLFSTRDFAPYTELWSRSLGFTV